MIAADALLALGNHGFVFWCGIALWGVHMALTQGLLARMVADAAPADLRGTAYGLFNLMSGLALLLASVLAGLLWEVFGAASTFVASAAISAATLAVLGWRSRFA